MKNLILGSSGQIGSHLVNFLKSIGEDAIEFDIEISSKQDLRIEDNRALYEALGSCDFVYFLAFDVGGSCYLSKHQNDFNFISNNTKIMYNVFDGLRVFNKPFVFTSSQMAGMEYSAYGALKLVGEKFTAALNGINARLWNIYGYNPVDSEKNDVVSDFIKMAKEKTIKMRTNGEECRQFLYGDDCSECLHKISTIYKTIDRNKKIHISSFEWHTVKEVAEIISKFSGAKILPSLEIDDVQKNAQMEPDQYVLNFWKPKTSLENGLRKIYYGETK